jgi:DNA invertase Pin-like site-specific DNA recombinase
MPAHSQAVAYLRVSSKKQKGGSGLERQRAAVEVYAKNEGIEIVRTVTDASTAYDELLQDRTRLQDALATCESLRVPILVQEVSRLVRRQRDMTTILDRGIRVISVVEGSERSRLLAAAAAAEVEAEHITTRTRTGQRHRSKPPENLTSVEREKGRAQRELGRAKRDDIVEQVLDDLPVAATYQMIADELNRRGHRTERGMLWSVRSVERPVKRVRQRIDERRRAKNPNFGRF